LIRTLSRTLNGCSTADLVRRAQSLAGGVSVEIDIPLPPDDVRRQSSWPVGPRRAVSASKRAVLVASRHDHMLWAKSNKAALRSGAYFVTRKNVIELPSDALAHSSNALAAGQQQTTPARLWFPREPQTMMVNEMIRGAGEYGYTLTLLLLPEAEWQGAHHDDEESEEDTYDRFIRNGQYPVR
jgi:hypothetical protein